MPRASNAKPNQMPGFPTDSGRRILFFGEAVTLAHVLRPLGLAVGLQKRGWTVAMACDPRHGQTVRDAGIRHVPVATIDSALFLRRAYWGRPLYRRREIRVCVQDDLRAIAAFKPDIVAGDFRLSLAISAELAGIPHVKLSNVHWSPALRRSLPLPDHPMIRFFGIRLAELLMKCALPIVLRVSGRVFNRVRRDVGLPPACDGMQALYTQGDRTLYLDIPELYDAESLSETEECIGPVQWTPQGRLPAWWARIPRDRPALFVSPGSSGDTESMLTTLRALAALPATVLLATAGCLPADVPLPANVFAADFIPAAAGAERADAMICNGGSCMVYHALAAGIPLLGLPYNADQYHVMRAVERKGFGLTIRSGQVTEQRVKTAVQALLKMPAYRERATALREKLAECDPAAALARTAAALLERPPRRRQVWQRQNSGLSGLGWGWGFSPENDLAP